MCSGKLAPMPDTCARPFSVGGCSIRSSADSSPGVISRSALRGAKRSHRARRARERGFGEEKGWRGGGNRHAPRHPQHLVRAIAVVQAPPLPCRVHLGHSLLAAPHNAAQRGGVARGVEVGLGEGGTSRALALFLLFSPRCRFSAHVRALGHVGPRAVDVPVLLVHKGAVQGVAAAARGGEEESAGQRRPGSKEPLQRWEGEGEEAAHRTAVGKVVLALRRGASWMRAMSCVGRV